MSSVAVKLRFPTKIFFIRLVRFATYSKLQGPSTTEDLIRRYGGNPFVQATPRGSANPLRSECLRTSRRRTGCAAAAHTQQRKGTWQPTRFASPARRADRSAP